MTPSERYRVLLNTDNGRTHLLDTTVPTPVLGGDPSQIVCCNRDGGIWPVFVPLTDRGPVDDHLIGPTTWGGGCARCYRIAWDEHLAAVTQ